MRPYFGPQKPCEKPVTVARTLGGHRVLWPDSLAYLGTACPVREALSKNKMGGGGIGSVQVKPILHVSHDMIDTQKC